MNVLIVDDDPSLRLFLEEVVQVAGHRPVTAEDGRQALEIYAAEQPDIVFSDLQMPRVDGLELLKNIRLQNTDTVFVVMTGASSENMAREALELRANNYLSKPIRHDVIISLLEKYGPLVQGKHLRAELERNVKRRELSLCIDNRLEMVAAAADFLVSEVEGIFDANTLFGIRLGLYEIIMNAVEHGNLEITSEEKKENLKKGPENHLELVRERKKLPRLKERKVRIVFNQNSQQCVWTISDEGKGFDWTELKDPFDHGLESLSGRGVYLARFQFDEFTFLGKGNCLRVSKNIPSALQQEAIEH